MGGVGDSYDGKKQLVELLVGSYLDDTLLQNYALCASSVLAKTV